MVQHRADQELAAKLAESSSCQSSEWEERQKGRAEELFAFHERMFPWRCNGSHGDKTRMFPWICNARFPR